MEFTFFPFGAACLVFSVNAAVLIFGTLRKADSFGEFFGGLIKSGIGYWLLYWLAQSLVDGQIGVELMSRWLPPLNLLFLCVCIPAATLLWIYGAGIFSRIPRATAHIRTAFLWGSPLLLLMCAEFAWNRIFPAMQLFYVLLNCILLGLLELCIVCVSKRGQMARLALLYALMSACGTANAFVLQFKGQPVLPADLSGAGTAAAVAGQYTYELSDGMAASVVLAYVCICFAFALGGADRRVRNAAYTRKTGIITIHSGIRLKKTMLCRPLCALCAFLVLAGWFLGTDFSERYWIFLDMWNPVGTYESYGLPLSFTAFLQKMRVQKPDGYSTQAANALLNDYAPLDGGGQGQMQEGSASEAYAASATSGQSGQPADMAVSADTESKPTVIAIMNESFSDLSVLGPMQAAGENLQFLYSMKDDPGTIEFGLNYVSTRGGGTSTSEFEFLTGNSMSNLIGMNPYSEFDFSKIPSMTAAFKQAGYQAVAMHPENPDNWRRSTVYKKMGFDAFLSKEDFEGFETLAWERTSDLGDYQRLIQEYEARKQDDAPLFLFNVTMQNHSSYDLEQIPQERWVQIDETYAMYPDVQAYESLIHASDDALAYLIGYFRTVREPVIICFFGDHQPALDEEFQEALVSAGETPEDTEVSIQEKYYAVPYFIWSNQPATSVQASQAMAGALDGSTRKTADGDAVQQAGSGALKLADGRDATSTNYLGIRLKAYAGLPLSAYDRYLLAQQESIPVLNFIGYQDRAGNWYSLEADSGYTDILNNGSILQYNAMFDPKKNWAYYGG